MKNSNNGNMELFPELVPMQKSISDYKEIQYHLALDEQGTIVTIDDAVKGQNYRCPGCNIDFILKKSGNTGKGSRRPHFAHNNLEGSCSHESYLHNTFKLLTFQIIKARIADNIPLVVKWNCIHCKNPHSIDLIPLLSDARIECVLSDKVDKNQICRPDIALINKNDIAFMVIEIVVTHEPEPATLDFFQKHNIPFMRIKLYSETDIENIETLLSNPTSFSYHIQSPVVQVPQIIPASPHYRSSNGVPRDFIDNPNKYYQAKNGNIYRKWRGKRR